jgi:transcriptional regulator with XRE-family HTH domain
VNDHPLSRWAKTHGIDRRQLAQMVGVSTVAIWGWIAGRRQPRIEHALRIQEITAGYVPVTSWAKGARQ